MKKLFLKLLAPITIAATALPTISCGGFLFPQTAKYYRKELDKIIDSKYEYKVYEYSKEFVDFVSRGQTLITTKEFVVKGINEISKIPLFYGSGIGGYAITLDLSSFLKHLNSLGKLNFYRYLTTFHWYKQLFLSGQMYYKNKDNYYKKYASLTIRIEMSSRNEFVTLYLSGTIQKTENPNDGYYEIPSGSYIKLQRSIWK